MNAHTTHRPRLTPVVGVSTTSTAPLTVGQVMITPAITVRRGTTVHEALRAMRQYGVEALIVDQGRRGPFGIVTLRDLQSRDQGFGQSQNMATIDDAMSTSALMVAPAMWAEDCATLMMSAGLHRALVIQSGSPVGIICDSDIFQAIESRRS